MKKSSYRLIVRGISACYLPISQPVRSDASVVTVISPKRTNVKRVDKIGYGNVAILKFARPAGKLILPFFSSPRWKIPINQDTGLGEHRTNLRRQIEFHWFTRAQLSQDIEIFTAYPERP